MTWRDFSVLICFSASIPLLTCDLNVVLLYQKITETVTSQPDYKLKWDDKCKIEGGNIHASFTIALEADFDEEVMEVLEMMEGEVAGSEITFQSAME